MNQLTQITRNDYIFEIDIDVTRTFYAESKKVFDGLSDYLPELTDFLSSLGIDMDKPVKYNRYGTYETDDLVYQVFGKVTWREGYEIDFYGKDKYVSVVVSSKKDGNIFLEVFGIQFVTKKDSVHHVSKQIVDLLKNIYQSNKFEFDINGKITLLDNDRMFLEINCPNKTQGSYYYAHFVYGKEESEIESEVLDKFIFQVVESVKLVYGKKIKVIRYSNKFRSVGKKYYYLNQQGEWILYDSFETKIWFVRLFLTTTYINEVIYDLTL